MFRLAVWLLLASQVQGIYASNDDYLGFDPLDWSIDMVELAGASYLFQDRYLVYIPPFRIARFQVTQQLYNSIMNLSRPKARNRFKPVVRITWVDAVRFSNKLSKLAGLEPAYHIRELRYRDSEKKIMLRYEVTWLSDKSGYRLPTEAEWEYAARGGKQGGYLYSGSNVVDKVAWYDGNSPKAKGLAKGLAKDSGRGLRAVGEKEPNEIGLYDMSGNAWDWLWDRHVELKQSVLARRERLEQGRSSWVLKPEILVDAYRSEGRSLGHSPDEPSVQEYVRKYLVWHGPKNHEGQRNKQEDWRVCRGGAWNFAKVHSEIMQRSPCIAEADYYVSVSFRLAQNADEEVQ